MQTIKPYTPAVYLIGHAGIVATYASAKAALDALGINWFLDNLGDTFDTACYLIRSWPVVERRSFVLRTEQGDPITLKEILALRRTKNSALAWNRLANWNGKGPVPGTGRHRRGGYCRSIRHVGAKRQTFFIEEEGEVAPRAARKLRNLPDGWDDYPISARFDRSWKRYRKHQYKR